MDQKILQLILQKNMKKKILGFSYIPRKMGDYQVQEIMEWNMQKENIFVL